MKLITEQERQILKSIHGVFTQPLSDHLESLLGVIVFMVIIPITAFILFAYYEWYPEKADIKSTISIICIILGSIAYGWIYKSQRLRWRCVFDGVSITKYEGKKNVSSIRIDDIIHINRNEHADADVLQIDTRHQVIVFSVFEDLSNALRLSQYCNAYEGRGRPPVFDSDEYSLKTYCTILLIALIGIIGSLSSLLIVVPQEDELIWMDVQADYPRAIVDFKDSKAFTIMIKQFGNVFYNGNDPNYLDISQVLEAAPTFTIAVRQFEFDDYYYIQNLELDGKKLIFFKEIQAKAAFDKKAILYISGSILFLCILFAWFYSRRKVANKWYLDLEGEALIRFQELQESAPSNN